jgi:hypothetical protein
MGDPDRLLNVTSDADDLERELLASVRNVGPPRGAKDEGWAGIAAQLTAVGAIGAAAHSAATAEAGATSATAAKTGIGAVIGSGSSGAVTSAMSKALVGKIVVALAIGGSTVGAGTWYMQHRSAMSSNPTPMPDEPSRAAAPVLPAAPAAPVEPLPSPEPVAASPSPNPVVNAPPAQAETVAAPSSKKPVDNSARPRESLDAESEMIAEARAELRRGDARASMATLDRLRAQFPKGVLAQEREVLGVEVLAALGDAEGASRKARAFSESHPNSPFTAKLRRFIIEE